MAKLNEREIVIENDKWSNWWGRLELCQQNWSKSSYVFWENLWILTPATNALLWTNCLRIPSRFPVAPSLTKVQNKVWQTKLNCNRLLKTSRDTIVHLYRRNQIKPKQTLCKTIHYPNKAVRCCGWIARPFYVQVHNYSTGSSKFTLICRSTYLKKKTKGQFLK